MCLNVNTIQRTMGMSLSMMWTKIGTVMAFPASFRNPLSEIPGWISSKGIPCSSNAPWACVCRRCDVIQKPFPREKVNVGLISFNKEKCDSEASMSNAQVSLSN